MYLSNIVCISIWIGVKCDSIEELKLKIMEIKSEILSLNIFRFTN